MSGESGSVTLVTQTCVREGSADAFARWQGETSTLVSTFPGFVDQRLLPPNPPLQVDWVILQTFASVEDAKRWLASPERQKRIEGAASMLVGRDDVHIMRHGQEEHRAGAVSAVISTRVKPGKEAEYRAWERKIAAAQSKAPGIQGYRFEPPVPGVQQDYVAYLRFDSEANLNAWLESPERKKLVEESNEFVEEFHARMVRTGFEQWFREAAGPGAAPLPVWKMDMLVLLMLYPVVFLWSIYIGFPYLGKMSFALSLFLGNIFSVGLTGVMVPWVANRFGWWLTPAPGRNALQVHLLGTAIILALYAVMVVVFATQF